MIRVSPSPSPALVVARRPAGCAKTLVFCSEGNPEALNPQLVTTTTGMNAGRPMFNNLVEFAPGIDQIAPGLAESWTVSEDGREYTFRLRAGVRFHASAPSRRPRDDERRRRAVLAACGSGRRTTPITRVSGVAVRLLPGSRHARSS